MLQSRGTRAPLVRSPPSFIEITSTWHCRAGVLYDLNMALFPHEISSITRDSDCSSNKV